MRGLFLLFAAAAAFAQDRSGFSLRHLDGNAQPCQNFFQFACGGWIRNNPIPGDLPGYKRTTELNERNLSFLREILEHAAHQKSDRTPVEQKIGDAYAACMDIATANQKGAGPVRPMLRRILAIREKQDLTPVIAQLHQDGADPFFGFFSRQNQKDSKSVIAWIGQGGYTLPDRDYYVKEDERSSEIRAKYVGHVARVFQLAGLSKEMADSAASAVLQFETALARAAWDRVTLRDPEKLYHPADIAELERLAPVIHWSRFFKELEAPSFDRLNVVNADFFRRLDSLLRDAELNQVKAYLGWRYLYVAAPVLSEAFSEENFDFFSRTLRGIKEQQPRWKRCVRYVDADLGEALGQTYVEKRFGAQAKERMTELIANLRIAMKKDIDSLDWMSPATKKRALEKLQAMQQKVGHPETWRDYSALAIKPDDHFGNSLRANRFEHRRELAKIGGAPDLSEWLMSPPTVNAYYNGQENNINFPAGILQPPFFDAAIDDAVNYGGIGMVIGHEITHGFDDKGRRYDAQGNLTDWWTEEDAAEYEKRASCFESQYAGYVAVDDVRLNGKLTLGENVADNAGLRIAYMALEEALAGDDRQQIAGFTPEQRFFLGFAQVFCGHNRPETARVLALTDPHSPPEHRVNGPLSNMPEFWQAFSCRPTDPMVRGDAACRVW
jgi:endothelin-converting enzyme/putative endopeptidase